MHEFLDEEDFARFAAALNEGLRKHPGLAQGAGITALVSFVDILKALKTLKGHILAQSITLAALSAFPHRIRPRSPISTEQAVKEVLFRTLTEYEIDLDDETLNILNIDASNSRMQAEPLNSEVNIEAESDDSLLSVDSEIFQLFKRNEGAAAPSMLDVVVGLLTEKSVNTLHRGLGFIRVTPEFLERLRQLGILVKDSRLNVYAIKLNSSDPRKLLEIRQLFEDHIDQLVRIGAKKLLDGTLSRE
ncbi:MAG: hypothetical protein QXF26_01485, partial [Candidatus Bathyarchaeia archaeon]